MDNSNKNLLNVENIKRAIHKKMISVIICSVIVALLVTSFAYITYYKDNYKRWNADLVTGKMALVFEDRDNGINASLQPGEEITKKFSIENKGTLIGNLSFEWVNMVNTYTYESLSYNLEYCSENCLEEDAVYTELLGNTNVPVADKPITQPLASEISVPAGQTYYYKLNLRLNNLKDIDQTADYDANFTTNFQVGEASKYRYYTLSVDPNGGVWKNFVETQEYRLKNGDTKEIPAPSRDGYSFDGWDLSGVASSIDGNTFSMGMGDTTLVARWNLKKYTITININGEERTFELGLGESILLDDPDIEGRTFVGWNASGGLIEGNKFTLTDEVNVSISAIFSDNVYNYKVIHRQMSLDGINYEQVDSENGSLRFGESLTPPVKSYVGFTSPSVQTIQIGVDSESPSKNVIIYDYVRNEYTLTIDANGGTYNGDKTVNMFYEASIDLEIPTRDGYVFIGWDKTTGEVSDNKFIMGDKDASITAKWGVDNFDYIVNHKLMNIDGSTYTTVDSSSGNADFGTVVSADVKIYPGFNSPEKQSITISSDKTQNVINYLYERKRYDLVINPNGGVYGGSSNNTVKSLFYESSFNLGTPIRDGYTFTGWSNEGGSLDGSTVTMSDEGSVNVSANWSINSYTATVNYYLMDLDGENYTLAESLDVKKDFGSEFAPLVKEYVGFSKPDESTIVVGSNIDANVINYYYRRNQYTLTINPFGGIYNDSEDMVTRKLYYDESIDLGSASKVGYTFSRWKKTSADNGDISGNIFTMKDNDITVRAVYSPKTFTVTLNANGGTSEVQSKVVTYDGVYDELPIPEYEGYEFLGWFTDISDGEEITASSKVQILDNQTLYAHWRYATFTVTFDANGGAVDTTSKSIVYGKEYGDLPVPTLEKHEFLGWYTDQTSGTLIESSSIVNLREDHTLYAHYGLLAGPDATLKILGSTVKDGTPNFAEISPPAVISEMPNNVYKNSTITTKTSFNYDENDGSYTSTNKTNNSTATIILKPNTSTHLYLFYTVSSEQNYDKGTFFLNDVQKGQYSGEAAGVIDLGEVTSESTIKVTYYKDSSNSKGSDLTKFYLSESTDTTSNDDTGLYAMDDDYGTSYYYRGNILNNYVKFAGLYWRILRMNGDGSLRIIYDGAQAYANGVNNAYRLAINSQTWNNTYANDNKYLGYMYGGANGVSSTSRELAQTNETDSNAKTQLEKWYSDNIGGYGLDEYVEDSIFCNDRSLSDTPKTWWTNESATPGFGTNYTAYGPFSRFLTTANAWNITDPKPTFKCHQKNDSFTKNNLEKGNGKLREKIGLATADEIVAAGSGVNKNNTKYYLYKGSVYYTMSPRNYGPYMMNVDANGGLSGISTSTASGLAPVINLSAEYVASLKGTGTSTDPFKYSEKEIKITFDANGGSAEQKGMFKDPGEQYGELPVLERNGYIFDGWFTEANDGEEINASTVISSTENHTIYAHWSPYVDSRATETLNHLNITPNSGTPTFTNAATTDEGVYSMPDDYGNSYYYRGAVDDNYVYFAGFYWRIIRVNGDGSLRIIYDGTDYHANGENNKDRLVTISQNYNSIKTDNKYLGYMYSPNGTGSTTSFSQAQTNEVNSNLKTQLENWYKTNIADRGYDSYVADSTFCSDRSIPGKAVSGWSSDTGFGYGTNTTAYGSYVKIGVNKSPQFTCSQKNDRFTKEESIMGNASLDQKVGTITGDEILAAGGLYNVNNLKYYLYKGTSYWTMSPYYYMYSTSTSNGAYVITMTANGGMMANLVTVNNGLVPVINLSHDSISTFHGTGTTADPYREYNENEVVVTLDAGDISIKPNNLIRETGEVYGELPTPVKTGYTFDGWYTKANGNGTKVSADTVIDNANDHTIYANMIPNNYTVSLNGNGVTSDPSTITVTYDSTYGTLPSLERNGYTFVGWYTSTSGGTKIEEDTKVTITANQTLYARWTANKYTVTYDANTGVCTTASKQVTFGSKYGTLATPTKEGYNFLGWYTAKTNGTKITANSSVNTAEDHTLYALWSLKSFTISFNANGGSNNTGVTSRTVYWGEAYGYFPYVYRDGYQFDGWYTSSSGGTKVNKTDIVKLTANQTLYAHWIGNNYTVTFDANHGVVDTSSMTVTMGSAYGTLPTPTNSAGTFLGWYTAKTGGSKITNTTKVSTASNHTLYARWSVSSGINVTLNKLNITANSGSPNFATYSTTNEGVYTMADTYGTSYYYRGDITNNYVKFGKWSPDTYTLYCYYSGSSKVCDYNYTACERTGNCTTYERAGKDMYWRIIRVNGDGSLRIIYDGTEAHSNADQSYDRVIDMSKAFNSLVDDAKYVGYMYGPANATAGTTTSSTSKSQAQTNTVDSDMKSYLESWYSDNLLEYDSEIADKIFCNDRSVLSGNGYGLTDTSYGPSRFIRINTYQYPTGDTPRFTCPQKNDAFTKSDTTRGNGKLKQKVGLATVDELIAAGLLPYDTDAKVDYNTKIYFSYLQRNTWTMSPYHVDSRMKSAILYEAQGHGTNIGGATSQIRSGVAPVINLEPSIVAQFNGSGTQSNPYYLN